MKFLFLALSPLVLLPQQFGDCTKLHERPQFADVDIAADLQAEFEHTYTNRAVHELLHNLLAQSHSSSSDQFVHSGSTKETLA